MHDVKLMAYKTNASTGYTVVTVCAVETDGNTTATGPAKSYGIEADTLAAKWNGSVKDWLAWVKMEHQQYHGLHRSMEAELKNLVGTML